MYTIHKCVYVYIILFPFFFASVEKLLANYRERETEINRKRRNEANRRKKKPPVKYNNMKQLTKWNC